MVKKAIRLVIIPLVIFAFTVGCNITKIQSSSGENRNSELSSSTDISEEVTPNARSVKQDIPESAPQLDVVLINNKAPEQQIRAIQLTNSWFIEYEDGTGHGYNACSSGPLQVDPSDYANANLSLESANSEIELRFSDNYPPQSVFARCWLAEYAKGGQNAHDIADEGEFVKVSGNTIFVSADENDYIYEIQAEWQNGMSWYAFRVECRAITEYHRYG